MKAIEFARRNGALLILLPALACNWVPLTHEGENVRVLSADAVADCKKVGEVTAKTSDRAWIFARTDRKIHEELESLARNEAAELNGDSVVPIGTPSGGRQVFGVYRCGMR